jgi:hypothetical protein
MSDIDIKDRIRNAMFSGMTMSLRDDLCEMLDELWFETATLRAALDRAEADKAAAVEAMREAAIAACMTQRTKFADATKSDWERGNDSAALGCTYAIRAIRQGGAA